MARYIDADVLIKKMFPLGIGDGMYVINAKAAKSAIDQMPAADVVEVVHARWEKIHDDPSVNKYRCTNCKAEKMRDNYCPNCGAKMDGATDNNVGDKGGERKE